MAAGPLRFAPGCVAMAPCDTHSEEHRIRSRLSPWVGMYKGSTYIGAPRCLLEPHGSSTADGGWTPPQLVRCSQRQHDAALARDERRMNGRSTDDERRMTGSAEAHIYGGDTPNSICTIRWICLTSTTHVAEAADGGWSLASLRGCTKEVRRKYEGRSEWRLAISG